jgi:multiple sugar transport system substrate-binding protein
MPSAKEKFTIAVRKFGPFESAMQKFWDQYCEISGCKLELVLQIMDLHELHQTTLVNEGLHKGEFDLAHINTDWIYEGYQSGAFEILNPYIDSNPPNNFPQGWSNSLLTLQQFEGNIVGLPFHDGPECFIYRKDLFENHEEQAAYLERYGKQLLVPKTWDDFYRIAEFFNRPETNLYGSIFACFPDGHNTVFDFCLQLWTRGGSLIDNTGAIQLNTNAASEALDFYRKIVNDLNVVHPGSAEFDSVAAGVAFSRGEAAMMINWFGFATMCEVDPNSKVKGKIYVDLLPSNNDQTSASLNVYWLYTIGSGSRHKALAYDFLRFVTAAEQDKKLTLEGGIGCRLSTWTDTEINSLIPYYHKLETLHVVAKMLPQKQNWSKIATIIDQMVLDAMHGNKPSANLLEKAQQQINSIDQ